MGTPTNSKTSVSQSHQAAAAEPSDADKALAFDEIFRVLFVEDDDSVNSDKEWDQSTVELVGDIVRRTKSPE